MAESLMPCMNGDVTRWANGKYGKMEFYSDINFFYTISCRFIECDEHTGEPIHAAEEQPEKCPVIAAGFTAFILQNLSDQTYENEVDFYEAYYQTLRKRHIDAIKTIPGASHRDLDEEAYKNHDYLEKINLRASFPVFDYLIKTDRSMLQDYNKFYLDYIRKYSKYYCTQYSTFDQAITSCDLNDKILLHSILNFCTPPNKRHLDVYNDIVMLRANYIKAPGYCSEYIQANYQSEWKEFVVIIHTIKTTFESTGDLQFLLPRVYADENTLKAYLELNNEFRKKLTTKFDLFPDYVLRDEDPEKICDTQNITDELALYHLAKDPANKKYFSVLPQNYKQMVAAYKSGTTDVSSVSENPLKSNKPAHKKQGKKPVTDDKKVREIDVEKLQVYFKSSFKGMGNGNINYFENLTADLQTDRVAKDFAEIAFMIYMSDKLNNNKPKTFREWYKVFCEAIQCEMKSYYPKDLRNPHSDLKKLYNYLY